MRNVHIPHSHRSKLIGDLDTPLTRSQIILGTLTRHAIELALILSSVFFLLVAFRIATLP